MQEPKPLSTKVSAYLEDAGDVAARSVEARNETVSNRLIAGPEDDRNGRSRGLGREWPGRLDTWVSYVNGCGW
jgi:hypothetical protein